jgi:hypothetical protein
MNKKNSLYAALIMMCVITFSVTLGSCEKNDDQIDDENSLIMNVDTNGVNFTIKPFLDWGATLADVEKFMAKNYPGWEVEYDGELKYDSTAGRWVRFYSSNELFIANYFEDEAGNDFDMIEFDFYGRDNIKQLQDECVRSGLKYKGHICLDDDPTDLFYLYLSADEKLEVNLFFENFEDEGYWGITFQSLDKDDLNQLIDTTNLCINVDLDEDSYSLIPFMDWNGTLTDVRNYMTENYPDWEVVDGGAMIIDTLDFDSIPHWYTIYKKDSLTVFYHFDDIEGLMFSSVQYVCYESTDLTQNRNELTRNGLKYIGHCTLDFQDQISNYVYVPLSKEYYVSASSWTLYEGVWTIDIVPYNDEFMELVSKD